MSQRPRGRVRAVLCGPLDDSWRDAVATRFPDVDPVLSPNLAQALQAGQAPGCHVLLTSGGSSADAFLALAPDLRWIQTSSAGVDGICTDTLRARPDIVLTAARGIHGEQMAEHTLALILALTRSLPTFLRQQARREWKRHTLPEMRGRRLLVVGYGTIGRSIARLAGAVGLVVTGVRRKGDPGGTDSDGVRVVGIDRMDEELALSDYVVVTLPLTEQTRGSFDAARFARMRPGAFFVNVGRGPVVDEAALVHALSQGPLGGAALDVFGEEPLPPQSPLWDMPNVIVTPHVAAASPRYFEQVMHVFADNLGRFLEGEPLRHRVDTGLGY